MHANIPSESPTTVGPPTVVMINFYLNSLFPAQLLPPVWTSGFTPYKPFFF